MSWSTADAGRRSRGGDGSARCSRRWINHGGEGSCKMEPVRQATLSRAPAAYSPEDRSSRSP
jgi:hypothetical protein